MAIRRELAHLVTEDRGRGQGLLWVRGGREQEATQRRALEPAHLLAEERETIRRLDGKNDVFGLVVRVPLDALHLALRVRRAPTVVEDRQGSRHDPEGGL